MSLDPKVGDCFEDSFRPAKSCSINEERIENDEKRRVRG